MEIILVLLLVAAWAVFVLPSLAETKREKPVNREPVPQSRRRPPAAGSSTRSSREQVLARRRMALIALAVLAIGTLAVAIVTGSWPILAVSLVVDVLLAGYIAMLLQIKQNRPPGAPSPPPREQDVKVF